MICKICNENFNSLYSLVCHIKKYHKMTAQEYYDNNILENNKEKYADCGNEKKFLNLRDGYMQYCILGLRCSDCQKKRNLNVSKNHADVSGKNNPMFGKKRSKEEISKMRKTKLERNKLRDRNDFNPYFIWTKKYGIVEANKREKKRRDKEWSTKLEKISNQKYFQSNIEKLFFSFLEKLNIKIEVPNRINRFVVDAYIVNFNYYIQIDGVFYHGLDKRYEDILLFSKRGGLYETAYRKFVTDRELDLFCIRNNIKLCRFTDLELWSSLNSVNCWNNFKDLDATTNLETEIVNALKNLDISQSAAELLKLNGYGESSTTIESTEIIKFLEASRVDFLNEVEKQSSLIS